MLRTLPLIYLVTEALTFILLGTWVGYGWAFLLLLASPIIGFSLARGTFRKLRQHTPSQRSTSKSTDTFTADIAVSVISAVLLVLPGIATFALGLLLLLPPMRTLVASRLGKTLGLRVMSFRERFTVSGSSFGGQGHRSDSDGESSGWGEVIDHRSDDTPPSVR